MGDRDINIAYKFAIAFLEVSPTPCTSEVIDKYQRLSAFIASHYYDLFCLSSQSCNVGVFESYVAKVGIKFDLNEIEKKLILLVLKKKDVSLLPAVFKAVVRLIIEQGGYLRCQVETSHDLSAEDKKRFIDFFSKKSQKKIMADFTVNPALMLGIKVKSNMFFWEKSISFKLKKVAQEFFRKGA